jgi:hypothetical protein
MLFSFSLLCSWYFTSLDQEEFENTKGVIIIRKLKKNKQPNVQKKKVQTDKKPSTTHIHTTNIEKHQSNLEHVMNSCALEEYQYLYISKSW